jgi:predicted HTH domain antitoxin
MTFVIPDRVAQATRLTESEIQQEFAIWLFSQDRLSLGQASAVANLSIEQFLGILSERGIPIHYGPEELAQDMKTLQELDRMQ